MPVIIVVRNCGRSRADILTYLRGGGDVNGGLRPYIKTAEVYNSVISYILIIELGLI